LSTTTAGCEPAEGIQSARNTESQSKYRIRDGIVALSLANVCLISAWFPLLYDQDKGYFNKALITRAELLALGTNILGFSILAWLVMRAMATTSKKLPRTISDLLFAAMLVFPIDFCRRIIFRIPDYRIAMFFLQPIVWPVVALVLAAMIWQHRNVRRVAAVLLIIVSPLALIVLARIGLLCIGLERLAQHTTEPTFQPLLPIKAGQPRVIWVIFDETDQRLAFEERPTGVSLPDFDALRAVSLCATNAFPPGGSTLLSIPALTIGRQVSDVVVKNASDLSIKLTDTGDVVSWSAQPSIFSSARKLGFNSAIVGWFHPYGRIFSRDVGYANWHPMQTFEPAPAERFSAAIVDQLSCLGGPFHGRRLFIDLCRASIQEAVAAVTNSNYGLVYLHLPPPHKPGVYLPKKDAFTARGMDKATGYFNNLALADRALGKMRRAMVEAGEWDKAWFILSADHSWRQSTVYDGRRDLRVPFLIKAPAQSKQLNYSTQINTVLTHNLILAILKNELTNQVDVAKWIDEHHTSEMPVNGYMVPD
jgi:Sulfatase